jgi:transmembrane sensor
MSTTNFQSFEDFILDNTFHEYVLGTSKTSVSFWNDWIKAHPEHSEEIEKAARILIALKNNRKIDITVDKYESLKELLSRINHQETTSKPKISLIPAWAKIAAVIAVSIGLSWFWTWTSKQLSKEAPLVYNEIIVPVGEKSQIKLSDGTQVWINSGSKLKYPVTFGNASREVYLSGEAFFDVTHREKQSFVVNTHDSRVKVLGTAFNVKAYPEDPKTQTTVVRGLVSVQNILGNKEEILVKPYQMATLQKNNETDPASNKTVHKLQLLNHINVDAVTCWKNQLLVFSDEPLGDMTMKMERWFNVKIIIEDSTLKTERYNGKFVHNETIYEVLEAIKQTTSIKYYIKNNQIIIDRKKH